MLISALPPALYDIGIIFGLAIIVLLVCNYFKIPTVIGFLLTGVVAGPDVLNLVRAESDISLFAEIGIILLLFSIGIEFSLKDLLRMRRQVFLGGALQLFGTVIVVTIAAIMFDLLFKEAIFIGFLFSLSSTAIVLKILQEKGRLQSPQGRSTMAILIFQDIAVVPLMLLTPYLSKEAEGLDFSFVLTIIKGILTVIAVIVISRTVMPRLLFLVARGKSNELFLLTILMVCLSVAWLTSALGLSLSLGAFLAGLIISESEYSHEAFGTILPFRDVFTSFFFISIGLLVNMDYFLSHVALIAGVAILIMIVKTLVAGGAIFYTGNNARVALIAGLFVCQVGEFSFILAETGREMKVINEQNYQLFLAVSLASMAATPILLNRADQLTSWISGVLLSDTIKKRFPRLIKTTISQPKFDQSWNDHVVIIGFTDTGKNISRVIRMAKIPFLAIDMDPEVVLAASNNKKTPVVYGNASKASVLKHANIDKARAVVITIKNVGEIKAILSELRKLAPSCYVLTTSRSLADMSSILESGANEVISEQFESSVEIVTRLLSRYFVPRNEIDDFVVRLRGLNYEMVRTIRYEHQGLQDYRLEISDTEILTFKVLETSPFAGKRLMDLQLRNDWGVSVLAIKRGVSITANPSGNELIQPSDILVVFGNHSDVDRISRA
ncbi:MAG: cation:proton antiporter [Bacteroidia bacterium]